MFNEELHKYAREVAETLENLDKKQLRFNDIVECSLKFYNEPMTGVRELVQACDKGAPEKENPLYVLKRPMWEVLNTEYRWLLEDSNTG